MNIRAKQFAEYMCNRFDKSEMRLNAYRCFREHLNGLHQLEVGAQALKSLYIDGYIAACDINKEIDDWKYFLAANPLEQTKPVGVAILTYCASGAQDKIFHSVHSTPTKAQEAADEANKTGLANLEYHIFVKRVD
jgi:hypothetical protein